MSADEVFLDELFDRLTERLRAGAEIDLEAELDGQQHLHAAAEQLLLTARQLLGERAPQVQPQVPGYELVRELGRGSMGVVYLARQPNLGNRLVALKVLPTLLLGGERPRSRFLAEAQSLARLRHPNVIRLFDVTEDGGLLAYAMEWIEGETLADLIRRRASRGSSPGNPASHDRAEHPPARFVPYVTRLGVDLAHALDAVHAEGLLHRDVKPSNVLLREDGSAILSDFGLVKDREASLHTQTGAFVGTLAFAAPEQIRGDEIDVRADVYSLAATLYQTLTSKLPYEGTNSVQVLRAIEGAGAAPLRRLDRRLPRDLETVLAKAMNADPRRRYASAQEFAQDLERILDLQPVQARPLGPAGRGWRLVRRNSRLVSGGAAGFLLAAAVVVGLLAWQRHLDSVQRRAAELTRVARRELLSVRPQLRMRLARTRGMVALQRQLEEAAVRALAAYERSLALDEDRPEVAAERDAMVRVIESFRAPQPRLRVSSGQPTTPDELRADGLVAYCRGELELAIELWEQLELAGGDDAFLQSLLGHVYFMDDQPGRAYPRLLRASKAFPEVGFVHLVTAEAALRCGDANVAEALLAAAEATGISSNDTQLRSVRAKLLWLQDRHPEALLTNGFDYFDEARMSEAAGDLESAMGAYANVLTLGLEDRHCRALLRVARSWWDGKSDSERRLALSRNIQGKLGSYGSLLGVLVNVRSAYLQLAGGSSERPRTVFTIDADPMAFDRSLTSGEVPPASIEALALRARVAELDLARCTELPEELREELIEHWLGAGEEAALRSFLEVHSLLLPAGTEAFGPRVIPVTRPLRTIAALEPIVHFASEFWRHPLAPIGDLDGDGLGDVLLYTASQIGSRSPRVGVRAHSGRDGAQLYSVLDEGAWNSFGSAVTALPDVNGDGVDDWVGAAAGLSGMVGYAVVCSGANGERLARCEAQDASASFGNYVAGAGDIDGDGIPEFAIGSFTCGLSGPHSGCISVYSATGELRYTVEGGIAGDHFGSALAMVGDLNTDGVPEIAVGTEPVSSTGAYVDVISGRDGSRLFRLGGALLDMGWRARPNPAGDVDGDGIDDVAVGCFPTREAEEPFGRALVFSGRSGELILELRGEHPHAGFGENVAGIGDLDGDGRSELAVSSWGSRSPRPPQVQVFDADGHELARFPSLWRLVRLTDDPTLAAAPRFLAVRLGVWSRYANAQLGGEGSAEIVEWVGF